MQKETRSLNALKPQENVLLKSSHRHQYLTSRDIVTQAKHRAKHIVSEAYQDADLIQQAAYRAGYERGLLMAIEAVSLFVNNRKQLVNDVYSQLREDVKTLLMDAVNRESIIVALFENWVESVDKKEGNTPFHILLPFANRQYKSKLMEFIRSTHQGGVVFEYHQDSHYVFKYGEHLVEFSPETFVDSQADALLVNHDLFGECTTLSTEALYQLHEQIKKHLPIEETVALADDLLEGDNRYDND